MIHVYVVYHIGISFDVKDLTLFLAQLYPQTRYSPNRNRNHTINGTLQKVLAP